MEKSYIISKNYIFFYKNIGVDKIIEILNSEYKKSNIIKSISFFSDFNEPIDFLERFNYIEKIFFSTKNYKYPVGHKLPPALQVLNIKVDLDLYLDNLPNTLKYLLIEFENKPLPSLDFLPTSLIGLSIVNMPKNGLINLDNLPPNLKYLSIVYYNWIDDCFCNNNNINNNCKFNKNFNVIKLNNLPNTIEELEFNCEFNLIDSMDKYPAKLNKIFYSIIDGEQNIHDNFTSQSKIIEKKYSNVKEFHIKSLEYLCQSNIVHERIYTLN